MKTSLQNECTHSEKREFQVLLALTFMAFLVVVVFGRLLPASKRPFADPSAKGESILSEAKRAAYTFVPMAFMR